MSKKQTMCDYCKKIIVRKYGLMSLRQPATFKLVKEFSLGDTHNDFCSLKCCLRWLLKEIEEKEKEQNKKKKVKKK